MKIFRVIGSEGRVTIPRDLRIAAGLTANEIVSFEPVSADAVLVRRERLQELPEAQEEMPSLHQVRGAASGHLQGGGDRVPGRL